MAYFHAGKYVGGAKRVSFDIYQFSMPVYPELYSYNIINLYMMKNIYVLNIFK